MSKIEKTRENIGVNKLDEKTKKELFNKFIQAGGQVITEKKERGLKDFDREKQKLYRQKIEEHKEKLQKAKPLQTPITKQATTTPKTRAKISARGEQKRGSFATVIDRLTIRFKLLFLGVADFWGGYYKAGFIERFNTEYKAALLELQMIYLDLFKQNPSVGKKIIEKLDSIKPLYYELIEKLASIYDRGTFMLITQAYEEFPNIAQKVSDYREFFLSLFKKLYVLYPYTITIGDAFEKAIGFQQEIEKQKSSLYSSKRRKAKNDIYIVFNKLFPRLYWLFCNYQDTLIPITDSRIETILGITDDDKPGKRLKGAEITEVEIPLPRNTEAQSNDENEPLSPEIKKGIELMYGLDIKKLRKEFDRENRFRYVNENDPILITYILLKEFDREYSLILTTNKIKYNTIYESSGKIDYRTRLSDLYNEMRESFDVLRQYIDALELYEKTRSDKPFSNTQYIEYSKKLTQLEKGLKNLSARVRMTISAYMDKVANELKYLIDDMNGRQLIVVNPQDVLIFESELEGEKKLSGKKVYECLYLAHCFAAAFSYRLSIAGDLGGKSTEVCQEAETQNAHMQEQPSQELTQSSKKEVQITEEGSILKELDDFL